MNLMNLKNSLDLRKLILISAVLLFNGISYSQWYQQSSNTSSTLKSVFFINKTTGWACGFETVIKTIDGGSTWTASFLEGYHKSVFFLDETNGWICGEGGRIYKTINGGNNWITVNSSVPFILNQITFSDNNTGVVTGYNKTILKTTNSGLNWININGNERLLDFHSVKLFDNFNYIVTGTESSIYSTSDGGLTWDTLSLGEPNPLLTVEFVNQNTGWVNGCCGMFIKTTNAGLSWGKGIYLTPGYSIYSMKFINENTGWVAGDAGYILRTTNGGQNWDSLNSLTHSGLYSVFFINKDTGFVAGYNGLILKTTNGGGEGYPLTAGQLSSEIPATFILHQNYPNPFNPVTVIRYSIPSDLKGQSSNVKLTIYNSLGSEVDILVNEKYGAGNYEVKWNASGSPSGIYYYRLESGNFSQTKKMLLIK